MKHPTLLPLVSAALASGAAPAAAQPPAVATLRVSQALQLEEPTPTLRVYLDVLDGEGESVTSLDPAALSATVGEATARTVGLEPLRGSREGVAYIFLVDVSRSLSANEFDRIRGALDLWLAALDPADRVAVIAFGEASRLELDFTGDAAAARAALARLGPSDDLTVFHRALRDGLELARRRDPGLPGRRVLVVLSDGKDEGSGLSSEDMLAALRADPVPIYAIGFSRLRAESERRRYLDLLLRLATNSGGAYVEAAQAAVAESYSALRAAIRRVWVATLVCDGCRLDGESYRLQVNLADGERVLSDGRPVRLLPLAAGAEPAAPPPAPPPADEPEDEARPAAVTEGGERSRGGGLGWALLPLLLLALAAVSALWLWRRREAAGEPEPPVERAAAPPASEAQAPGTPSIPYEIADGVLTSRPPKPPSLRLVRLVVVRGERVGRQYSMMLLERGVVGSSSSCDCVLVGEPGVEPEQFELLQIDGRVYIRNLAERRPTLLDGLPIGERQPLKSQALVGNGDCILRVIYDEPRRVPL